MIIVVVAKHYTTMVDIQGECCTALYSVSISTYNNNNFLTKINFQNSSKCDQKKNENLVFTPLTDF